MTKKNEGSTNDWQRPKGGNLSGGTLEEQYESNGAHAQITHLSGAPHGAGTEGISRFSETPTVISLRRTTSGTRRTGSTLRGGLRAGAAKVWAWGASWAYTILSWLATKCQAELSPIDSEIASEAARLRAQKDAAHGLLAHIEEQERVILERLLRRAAEYEKTTNQEERES